MTKLQRREYKKANQVRKANMLKAKHSRTGKNHYSSLHYGFIQDGNFTIK